MTANNFNLTNYYMDGTNNAGGILFVSTSYWVPHDNIPIIFSFENNTYSLSNNTYGDRFNMVIFFFDQVLYRSVKITINNFVFNELNDPHNLLFFIIGNLMSELYLNNTYLSNSAINKNVVRAYFFKNFVIDNMVLTNFTNIQASLIVTFYWYTAVINSIRLENTYFDSSLESDIILLNNFNFTYTSIQNIYFNNVTVNGHPLVRNVNLIFKVTIANWYLNNVYQAGTNPLFAIGKIGSIIFDNNTFSGITNSILHISKIDLRLGTNSQISNVRVSNSSATAITFGNFINPTSTMQTLLVENFTYTDSTISSAIDLIKWSSFRIHKLYFYKHLYLRRRRSSLRWLWENLSVIYKLSVSEQLCSARDHLCDRVWEFCEVNELHICQQLQHHKHNIYNKFERILWILQFKHIQQLCD